MPAKEKENKPATKEQQPKHVLDAAIGRQVLLSLGQPEGLHLVQVRYLWEDHYRVNVFIGVDAASAKVAHSYFLLADSAGKILADLRLASRKGDRAALSLALDQMRTLAHSPRYWEKYLTLLRNPLARLLDMAVIKQGERIAHQKGWKRPKSAPAPDKARGARKAAQARPARARPVAGSASQISLFE